MIKIIQNKSKSQLSKKVGNDFKTVTERLDEQARQIIKIEKQLYDTRDKLNKDITSLKNLQKLTRHIFLAGLGSKGVMDCIAKHIVYEMDFEKALIFIYKNNELKLGSFYGYKEKEVKNLPATKFILENSIGDEIKKKETLLFDFKSKHKKNSSIKNFVKEFGLAYFLISFLRGRKGIAVGFLLAGYSEEGVSLFSPDIVKEDVILFSSLANYAALFIENSQINEKLQQRVNELERFHRLTIYREMKMIELKKEIKELKNK